MKFSIGQQVRVGSEIRKLVRCMNTLGDWLLDKPVDGHRCCNEGDMVMTLPRSNNKRYRTQPNKRRA